MEKLKKYVVSYSNLFTILCLSIFYYFVFFHNIGAYPLMDADETRYVSMARDMFYNKEYLTLYLNGEYFFEKPPLYFWLETLSFMLFGEVNEFTARFPVSFLGSSICFIVYLMGKKIVSRSYGIISSVILATSIEYCMLSKLSILDIVVSACIAISLCFGLAVYFCRESRKKYYWWLFYVFSALAVIAKGIPGFVIPFGSMFFISLYLKKFKELFKPIYFIPGILLFLLITLPWHVVMFKMHNPLFWNEYIVKHHIARFLGADVIDRSEPFYFYFLTLLWGFFPWVISCTSVWIYSLIKNVQLFKTIVEEKFIICNVIITVFTLLFFSISSTKLITYILPMYPFLACLGGYVWWNYIRWNKNENIINPSNYFIALLMGLIAFLGIVSQMFLPEQLVLDLGNLRLFSVLVCFACSISLLLFTKKKIYCGVFVSLALFMTLFSAFATGDIFKLDYKFGQYDLMDFAKVAEENEVSLTTYKFGTKFSLIFYGNMPVVYGPQAKIFDLNQALNRKKDFVIIKNKEMQNIKNENFVIIKSGRKYSLIDKKEKRCIN